MTAQKTLVPFEGLVDVSHTSGARLCARVKGGWWGVVAEEQHDQLHSALLGIAGEVLAALPNASDLEKRPRNVHSAFEKRLDEALPAMGLKGQLREFSFRPESPPAQSPAAPTPAAAAAGVPELTIEQYASLCVERAMNPGAEGQVAQRYEVPSPEALQALDARWHQSLQADGALNGRFQQAYAQYEAWLRSQK